tara:strand:+ start:420 stop:668 length:249 start_codon:yes stop_codon:yes gene_type:complete
MYYEHLSNKKQQLNMLGSKKRTRVESTVQRSRKRARLTIEECDDESAAEVSVEMDWYIVSEQELPEPEEIIVWNGNFIICSD